MINLQRSLSLILKEVKVDTSKNHFFKDYCKSLSSFRLKFMEFCSEDRFDLALPLDRIGKKKLIEKSKFVA